MKVSADAKEASAAFSALAKDIKAVGTESVEVTTGVERVDAAMKKLASAPDTAAALARAVAKAKVEIDDLRASLEKTPASAAKIGAINEALAKAEQAMQRSIVRAGKLGEAQGAVNQQLGLTAKGAESLGGAFGSLDGIMGKMASSSSVASQNIAKVGFSVMAAGQAFEFGYGQGEKFREVLVALGVPVPNLSNGLATAAVNVEKFARGTQDTLSASKVLGGSFTEMALKLALVAAGYGKVAESENASIARAREIIAAKQKLAAAEQDAANAIQKAIPGWESMKSQQSGIASAVKAASDALVQITKSGGDWRKEVEANQKPLADLVKRIEDKKVALSDLPEPLRDAIEYLKQLQGATVGAASGLDALGKAMQGIGKGGASESIGAVAAALAQIKAEGGSVGDAVAANATGFQKLRTAAEGSYETLQKFRTEVMDQMPAYQATEIAGQKYAGTIEAIAAETAAYEAARRAANQADLDAGEQMAAFKIHAAEMAYSIDSIGDAWGRATGHAAGFTVEVRHATKAVEEADPEFTAYIESLASVSDEYERMTPYVGALIADLEAGRIAPEEFAAAIDGLRVAFMQIQGVSGQMFGDIESLFNRLRELVNEFTYGQNPRNKR
ncbi:MAG TPA: hypothetical protein DCQ64_22270 [Candidatus Rokubacteria bacterium]|nr:hypothetical protein [Candidatus Rokubacteria bacterium]